MYVREIDTKLYTESPGVQLVGVTQVDVMRFLSFSENIFSIFFSKPVGSLTLLHPMWGSIRKLDGDGQSSTHA